ncbi:MAG: ornithine cyclodeaminase family protein, partial [Dehalococcoidia bacterium]
GAASGVATKYIARPQARPVGIIGSGWQAQSQLMAVCAVRPVAMVRAYSRDPQRRQAFARQMSEVLGMQVDAADSAKEAVEGCDIVITATNASQPLFNGRWLSPGAHVNAIGANAILRREIDDATVLRCGTIVVDCKDQARIEAAELIFPIERGQLYWDQVKELGEVVAGIIPGRRSEDEITLFKSLGIAIWDVATAQRLYQIARQKGAGQELPF